MKLFFTEKKLNCRQTKKHISTLIFYFLRTLKRNYTIIFNRCITIQSVNATTVK